MMKKIIYSVGIVLLLIILMFMVDFLLVRANKKPTFAFKTSTLHDGGSTIYYGIGYKVINYKLTNGYQGIHLGSWFMKFDPDKYYQQNPATKDNETNVKKFTIVYKNDRNICASVMEKFYEDDDYEYYFSCAKSGTIFIDFGNGDMIPIIEALNTKKITIEQLKENGLGFYEKKKGKGFE